MRRIDKLLKRLLGMKDGEALHGLGRWIVFSLFHPWRVVILLVARSTWHGMQYEFSQDVATVCGCKFSGCALTDLNAMPNGTVMEMHKIDGVWWFRRPDERDQGRLL